MPSEPFPVPVCERCQRETDEDPVLRRLAIIAMRNTTVQGVYFQYRGGHLSRDEALITCIELMQRLEEAVTNAFARYMEENGPARVLLEKEDE
jgi:hypothetical protein